MFGLKKKKTETKLKSAKTDINVFMVGGRRTGKTTILTSMKLNFDNIVSGNAHIQLVPKMGYDMEKLEECREKIEEYFEDGTKEVFEADSTPTERKDKYSYTVKESGHGNEDGLSITFTDVPGEWFKAGERNDEIKEEIEKSQVIIIAVDTPSLMVDPQPKPDGVGKRHITNNRVECITNYFQNYFTKETIKENRLILFVPLKCEKWYYRTTNSESYGANPNEINYMREIANKIEKGYKGLIEWFKSPDLADKCTVAITPILSVGGMRFRDFGEGDSEKAIERERFVKIREKGYSPKYCEQPLLYTLAFAFKVFNKRKKEVEDNKSGIVKIWESAVRKLSGGQLCKEISDFILNGKELMHDEDEGFKILNNPMGL